MSKMKVLDLFSGIGGFSLGLHMAGGFETVAFCEVKEFSRNLLNARWPGIPCYGDVRLLTGERLKRDGISVDVICGGFPCQDVSNSGKKAGIEGVRSGLWSEIVRLVGELRPAFVIVENVTGLLARGLGKVLGDLASVGYDAEWDCLPGFAVGSPQWRDRLWIVAYPKGFGSSPVFEKLRLFLAPGACSAGLAGDGRVEDTSDTARVLWPTEPDLVRVADGFPDRLDRIDGLGNSVIPLIPCALGRAIMAAAA